LGAVMPKAGGYYIYLKEAFGKPIGFLSGFVNFVLHPVTILLPWQLLSL